MKKVFLNTLFIFLFSLWMFPVSANEIELDMPTFSDMKNAVQKSTNNVKDSAIQKTDDIKNNLEETLENAKNITENRMEGWKLKGKEKIQQGKEKIKKAKENANGALLKAGGKPTDESLSKLTKKEKQDLLLKYQDKGYYGTLPNIEREFDYIKQISKKTNLKNKYKDTLIDEMNLKKTPLDDELFLDVILKKEKDSKYTKDVLRMIPVFERFKDCISNFCDIQKFNANVNLVDLYARRLEKDYGNTNDAMSESFYLIRNVAYLAKLQGNLKYEANFYSKYMPLTGTIYSKEEIAKKDLELLDELNKTIFTLQQLK